MKERREFRELVQTVQKRDIKTPQQDCSWNRRIRLFGASNHTPRTEEATKREDREKSTRCSRSLNLDCFVVNKLSEIEDDEDSEEDCAEDDGQLQFRKQWKRKVRAVLISKPNDTARRTFSYQTFIVLSNHVEPREQSTPEYLATSKRALLAVVAHR